MKILVVLIALINVSIAFSQEDYESLKRKKRCEAISDFFWSPIDEALYAGVNWQYTIGTIGFGGELKSIPLNYGPLLCASAYTNYTHYPFIDNLKHGIGAGVHLSFLALETNIRFGESEFLWTITPKACLDLGVFRVAYGYNFPLNNESTIRRYQLHEVTIQYAMNVTAIKRYRRRYSR
jgi:hypothetical protein